MVMSTENETFCTVINCMDGRVQDAVNAWMKQRFEAAYVDVITEPGPNGILARGDDPTIVESIFRRIEVSVNTHGSRHVALVGHEDCAGNPGSRTDQVGQVRTAVKRIAARVDSAEVIGLWVELSGRIEEL